MVGDEMQPYNWKEAASRQGQITTALENIWVINEFHIPQLNRNRRIWIYLPPDYELTDLRYPVLYMHDGQNLFDVSTSYSGEWEIDKTLDRLFGEQKLSGLIVVGIDNGADKRMEEYIPSQEGERYASFIVDTLKPFIDQNLRTLPQREFTGVAGSSLGGLISLFLGLNWPDVFSKVGAFSPAMHFADNVLAGVEKRASMKLYLDVGTKEYLSYTGAQQYADHVWNCYYHLLTAGFDNNELCFIVEKDATHNEAAWAGRFAEAVLWLYG